MVFCRQVKNPNWSFRTVFLPILVLFLVLSGCLWSSSMAYAAPVTFTDLSGNAAIYPYASFLVNKDLLKGYPDGSFGPNRSLTRAETAALLARASGLSSYTPANPTFRDVAPGHWAYGVIEAAARSGLISGYSDGSFRPATSVSRAELAAFLLRLTKEDVPSMSLPASVQDVRSGHWAQNQIAVALDAGIMTLNANESFAPATAATRAQVAQGLAMMLNTAPELMRVPLTATLVPVKGDITLTLPGQQSQPVAAAVACATGAIIKTGANSEANLKFPDGTSLLLKADTELSINESRGQSVINRDGTPGTVVDWLEVKLARGKIFGALATSYFFHPEEEKSATTRGLKRGLPADKSKAPWWKEASAKRVRVKVDMPWGVAGIKGTFWFNEVAANSQTTSVIDGEAQVTAGGTTVGVGAGQQTTLTSSTAPPPPPAPMTSIQRSEWQGVRGWVDETANNIQSNTPMVGPPAPPQGQNPEQPPTGNTPSIAEGIRHSYTDSVGNNPAPSSDGGGGDSGSTVVTENQNLTSDMLDKPVSLAGGSIKLTIPSCISLADGAKITVQTGISAPALPAGTSLAGTLADISISGIPEGTWIPLSLQAAPGHPQAAIYYYNPSTGNWECQGGSPDETNMVTTMVNHFSTYAVLEDTSELIISAITRASNGRITAVLSSVPATPPQPGDFFVYQLVDNESPVMVSPTIQSWDESSKTVLLSVPPLHVNDLAPHEVVYQLSYRNTAPIKSQCFLVELGLKLKVTNIETAGDTFTIEGETMPGYKVSLSNFESTFATADEAGLFSLDNIPFNPDVGIREVITVVAPTGIVMVQAKLKGSDNLPKLYLNRPQPGDTNVTGQINQGQTMFVMDLFDQTDPCSGNADSLGRLTINLNSPLKMPQQLVALGGSLDNPEVVAIFPVTADSRYMSILYAYPMPDETQFQGEAPIHICFDRNIQATSTVDSITLCQNGSTENLVTETMVNQDELDIYYQPLDEATSYTLSMPPDAVIGLDDGKQIPGTFTLNFTTARQPQVLANDFLEAVVLIPRFTLGTLAGNPSLDSDDNQRLLYGWPSGTTSATTIRIDGTDYTFGGDPMLDSTSISVIQDLSLDNNYLNVRYSVTNNDTAPHEVGLRIMLDIAVGNNDGAPFKIGMDHITETQMFSGSDIPESWKAYDSLTAPRVIAQGWNVLSQTNPPDKFVISNWSTLNSSKWDHDMPDQALYDSAVALYWSPRSLAAGETQDFMLRYGVAPSEPEVGFDFPITDFSPGEVNIPIKVTVLNNGAIASNTPLQYKIRLLKDGEPFAGDFLIDSLPPVCTGEEGLFFFPEETFTLDDVPDLITPWERTYSVTANGLEAGDYSITIELLEVTGEGKNVLGSYTTSLNATTASLLLTSAGTEETTLSMMAMETTKSPAIDSSGTDSKLALSQSVTPPAPAQPGTSARDGYDSLLSGYDLGNWPFWP